MCKSEAESYLGRWSKRLQAAGLQADHVIGKGNPAQRIIEFINSQGVDLAVASSHGRGGLSGWSAGSLIHKVVFWSRISVMLARAHRPTLESLEDLKIWKVLVPLDRSSMAECVLRVVNKLTRLHDVKILLASVVRKPETPRRTPLSREDMEPQYGIGHCDLEEKEPGFHGLRVLIYHDQAQVGSRERADQFRSVHPVILFPILSFPCSSGNRCGGSAIPHSRSSASRIFSARSFVWKGF